MSCGPAEAVRELTESIDNVLSVADKALTALPLGIASIPGYVEAQLGPPLAEKIKLMKQLIEGQIPTLPGVSLPAELTTLISAGLAGAAALTYVDDLKEKYANLPEVDIDNIVELMTELGNDLDQLCKIVPNVQNIGGDLIVKGFPVSFPEIDPLKIIEEGKFPDVIGNIKDALKDVEIEFEPDPDKAGQISVSEKPGAPFRVNGSNRSQRRTDNFFGNNS